MSVTFGGRMSPTKSDPVALAVLLLVSFANHRRKYVPFTVVLVTLTVNCVVALLIVALMMMLKSPRVMLRMTCARPTVSLMLALHTEVLLARIVGGTHVPRTITGGVASLKKTVKFVRTVAFKFPAVSLARN